jgi:hypothetical protein
MGEHSIEVVGEKLRSMMPWIKKNKLVDQTGTSARGMHVCRRGMRRQRGWAGLVMLLVVVLIVAFLAKDALRKYLGPAATVERAGPAACSIPRRAKPPPQPGECDGPRPCLAGRHAEGKREARRGGTRH